MRKILLFLSILATSVGMKAFASTIDQSTNPIVWDLMNVGLTVEEIKNLDMLSKNDIKAFSKAIEGDMRIKGKLKVEVFATANKGGGPCISGQQD